MASAPASPEGGESSLQPFLQAFRLHWKLILATTLLATVAALAWLTQKTPLYQATARVLITPPPDDATALAALPLIRIDQPNRLAATGAAMLQNGQVAQLVAKRLDGWDTAGVEESVLLLGSPAGNLIEVLAQDTDAQGAAELANTYARTAIELRGRSLQPKLQSLINGLERELEQIGNKGAASNTVRQQLVNLRVLRQTGGDPTLSVAELALPPGKPEGLPPWAIAAIAPFLGLVIGCVAGVLIVYQSGGAIRDENELARVVAAPVLARIPLASRRSLEDPVRQAEIRQAYGALRTRLGALGPDGPGTSGLGSIAVVSPRAGDGRTAAALGLARVTADSGSPTILLDLDSDSASIAATTGAPERPGLVEALDGSPLGSCLSELNDRLGLLAAPASPTEADAGSLRRLASGSHRLVSEASRIAATVIVDTPAASGPADGLAAAAACDRTIVVVRIGRTRAEELERLREQLEALGATPDGVVLFTRA